MSQIILRPEGGISNRLKSIISANLLNKDYKVYWPRENFCGLKYSDIFCTSSNEIDFIPIDSTLLDTWRFELPSEFRDLLPEGFSDCSTGYKGINFPGDNLSRTIDFEYLKIPPPILVALKQQFARLNFREEIMARVRALQREIPDHYVGVHARTWIDEPERKEKWFNFDDFVKVCSRFHNKEIFVASDDPEFVKRLSEVLDKNLITIQKPDVRVTKSWHQQSPEELLDDIVELLVLSNSSQMVLTAMSTYSEVAWFIGGCSEEVYFADPDFWYKGHTVSWSPLPRIDHIENGEHDVHWIEVAGAAPLSYFLALIPGRHVHLDNLGVGAHKIADYVEKYSGYMKGSLPKDYMIDVGANLGLSAFPVASISRRVVAFEPVADNVKAMMKTIARNKFDNVTLIESAVSSRVGSTHIYVPLGRADNTSLGEDVANANVSRPEVHQFMVPTETIDHWFEVHFKEFSPVDAKLLKIDVQGYETEVLLGAKKFIAACRQFEKLVIEFEFDPKLTKMAGYSIVAILELIHSYGLEIYHNGTQIPADDYVDFCQRGINCDLIALFSPVNDSKKVNNNSVFKITYTWISEQIGRCTSKVRLSKAIKFLFGA